MSFALATPSSLACCRDLAFPAGFAPTSTLWLRVARVLTAGGLRGGEEAFRDLVDVRGFIVR